MGQLGSDYDKINKVWCQLSQNVNSLVYKKLNTALVDVTKCASKMYIACLKLRNLSILSKINDKRNAVLEHKKECFNSKSMKSSNLKIEYLVRTSCMLTAQLKTLNKQNIKISKLHHLDQKLKTISNGKGKKPIQQI